MWPFTSEVAKPSLRVAAPVKNIANTKKALVATAVFIKKTEMLCAAATNMGEQQACEQVASERLFCSMFMRHLDKFNGMVGTPEQHEACKRTNIMVTALGEAKMKLEEANSDKKND